MWILEARLSVNVEILCLETRLDYDQAHYRVLADAVGRALGWRVEELQREICAVKVSQLIAQKSDADYVQQMRELGVGAGVEMEDDC